MVGPHCYFILIIFTKTKRQSTTSFQHLNNGSSQTELTNIFLHKNYVLMTHLMHMIINVHVRGDPGRPTALHVCDSSYLVWVRRGTGVVVKEVKVVL